MKWECVGSSLVVVVAELVGMARESMVVSFKTRLFFHGEGPFFSFELWSRSGPLRALSSLRSSSPLSGSVPLLSSSCVVRIHGLLHHLNEVVVCTLDVQNGVHRTRWIGLVVHECIHWIWIRMIAIRDWQLF